MTEETTTTTAQTEAPETAPARFATFEEFYPFYISEHQNDVNRRLHVVSTGLAILCLFNVVLWGVIGGMKYLIMAPVIAYGMAWLGHYVFEKNEPATFKYPAWSLMGDFKMFFEVVTGKRAF